MSTFKEENSLENRKKEAKKMIRKYPDRIPVIVELYSAYDHITLDKKKFLVPTKISMSQFVHIIRKRIRNNNPDKQLQPSEAIYLFVQNTLPSGSSIIGDIYNEHHDEDYFLYMTMGLEQTYG